MRKCLDEIMLQVKSRVRVVMGEKMSTRRKIIIMLQSKVKKNEVNSLGVKKCRDEILNDFKSEHPKSIS